MKEVRVRLSTLWLFAVLNYLYADVVTLMDPAILEQIIAGQLGPLEVSEGLLLGAAVLMETAIAMVLLSRVLSYRANRWANMIVGALHTVVVLLSLFLGGTTPALYYIFFATIEIACTAFIVWTAWGWKQESPVAIAG